jgi:6-phosphogluconolactonase (cycloisomerase 2 family)
MKLLKVALVLFGLLYVLVLNGCSSGGGVDGGGGVRGSLDADTLNVKLLNPLPGATRVSPSPSIQVAFSKAVKGVNSHTIVLREGSATGPIVDIGAIVNGSNNIYTFSASRKLKANATHCLVLGAATGTNVGSEVNAEGRVIASMAAGEKLPETTFCFTTGSDSAPTVVPVVPSDGENGISTHPNIQVKFSEEVINVNAANVILHEGSPTGGSITLSDITAGSNNTFTFSPTTTLNQNTSYYVVLGSGITSLIDEPLAEYGFSFTTGDFGAPVASMISPSNNATGVSVSPSIQLQFSKEVINVNQDNVSLHEGNVTGPVIALNSITAGSNNTFTFSPATPLNQQTTYHIVLGSGIKDMMGHNLAAMDFSFTTGDFKAPTVSMISPSNNATGVSVSPSIQLQFSEEVSNVNPTNVTLHEGSPIGTAIPLGSLTAGANNTFTVSPSITLNQQTTYYVVVGAGITDLAGNSLVAANFSFTTGDFTAPTVNIVSPNNNATGVSTNPSIQLKFSKAVVNVTAANVTLRMGSSTGTIVPTSEMISGTDNTFTFSPSAPLNQQTTYYVVLGAGIEDAAGNDLIPVNFSFTTGDFNAPTVNIISPSNNAVGVSVSPSIQLKFSEAVTDVTAANITLHQDSPTGPAIPIGSVISGDDNTFTFSPATALSQQTPYYVVLGAGIKDTAGNALTETNFNFTTGDFKAPTVNMISPGSNATGISLSPSIQLKFSEAVVNVTSANITLRQGNPNGPVVPIGVVSSGADNTFTFSPNAVLNSQTTYYVVLSSGITDVHGNPLAVISFRFTTVVLDITAFSLDGTPGVISGRNIVVTLPFGTPVTNLVATYTTSAAVTSLTVNGADQVSGTTPNNFTNPVTYTVHADDSSMQNYTVKVILAAYTYVTNAGSNSVSMYILDTATGILQNRVDTSTGNQPAGIAVDPSGHYAYVANIDSNTLSMYSINSKTGALTSLGTIPAEQGPAGIVVDPSGHYVYVSYVHSSLISMYSINSSTGLLTAQGTVAGSTQSYSIVVDPSGRYVYSPTGAIFMYSINSSSGALTALTPWYVNIGGASVAAIDPSGRYMYVTNENQGRIFMYSINSGTGGLTGIGVISAGSHPIGITVDPSGRYAYAANMYAGTVSMYSINSSTGVLTSIGTIGAGAYPFCIKVDPSGRYVYVGNYADATMSMYSINSDGTLKSLSPSTVVTLNNARDIAIVYPSITPP